MWTELFIINLMLCEQGYSDSNSSCVNPAWDVSRGTSHSISIHVGESMRLEPQPSLSILPSPSLSERRGELPSTTIAMLSGMVQFPVLVPPTVDQSDDWLIAHDSETQLAQEEQELEEKVTITHGHVYCHLIPTRSQMSAPPVWSIATDCCEILQPSLTFLSARSWDLSGVWHLGVQSVRGVMAVVVGRI